MKAYRVLSLNQYTREMVVHHVWFWAADKDVRNFLITGQNIPRGDVAEADHLLNLKGERMEFVPCFSLQ